MKLTLNGIEAQVILIGVKGSRNLNGDTGDMSTPITKSETEIHLQIVTDCIVLYISCLFLKLVILITYFD